MVLPRIVEVMIPWIVLRCLRFWQRWLSGADRRCCRSNSHYEKNIPDEEYGKYLSGDPEALVLKLKIVTSERPWATYDSQDTISRSNRIPATSSVVEEANITQSGCACPVTLSREKITRNPLNAIDTSLRHAGHSSCSFVYLHFRRGNDFARYWRASIVLYRPWKGLDGKLRNWCRYVDSRSWT